MKRPRKPKPKRVKPDEVFGNGAVSVARFGKDIVWRSNLDATQIAEMQKHNAARYDDVVASIDALVARIRTQVSELPSDRLLHRAWWELAAKHIGIKAEVDVDHDGAVAMRMLDYIQSIIASTQRSSTPRDEVSDNDWDSLRAAVDELFQTVNLSYQICRTARALQQNSDLDLHAEAFFFKAQMYWCNVRGDRYQVHEEPHLRALFAPHSEVLEELYGLNADAFVTELTKIVSSLTRGVERAFTELNDFRKESLDAVERKIHDPVNAGKTFDQLFEETIVERGWEQRRIDVGNLWAGLDLFDVGKLTALPANLISELTWDAGQDTEFVAPGPLAGWPLRVWPTFKRPFIRLDGRACCFDLHSLCDHIYRIMSRVIRRAKPSYEEAWKTGQQAVSEQLPVTCLTAILPGSAVHRSVYYKWFPKVGHPTKEWCEADALIAYDDHLFVVESRGGAFTHSAPSTDFEAYISSLKSLLLKPSQQGQRFVDYLKSAETVELFDEAHNSVGSLSRDSFRHISVCAVTLDPFTELAAQAQHLKDVGVDVGQEPVWPISVDDLRVYADIFANPLEFLHFSEQRAAAFGSKVLQLDDELDHLGLYFAHNRYVDYAEERQAHSEAIVNFLGYRSDIDKFFAERLYDPAFPCPLNQGAPKRFVEIIDWLARCNASGRSRLASYLLDLGSDGRNDIEACVLKELKEQPSRGRPFALSTVGGLAIGSTSFIYLEGVTQRKAAVAVKAAREAMIIAGEDERLLLELSYDATAALTEVNWTWLRMDQIPPRELAALKVSAVELGKKRLVSAKTIAGKIGRNDICPCGSGKKYKKCCLP